MKTIVVSKLRAFARWTRANTSVSSERSGPISPPTSISPITGSKSGKSSSIVSDAVMFPRSRRFAGGMTGIRAIASRGVIVPFATLRLAGSCWEEAARRGSAKPGRQPGHPAIEHLGPGSFLQFFAEKHSPFGETIALAESAAPVLTEDALAGRRAGQHPVAIAGEPRHHGIGPPHRTQCLGHHRRVIAVAVLQRGVVTGESLEGVIKRRIRGSTHRTTSSKRSSVPQTIAAGSIPSISSSRSPRDFANRGLSRGGRLGAAFGDH